MAPRRSGARRAAPSPPHGAAAERGAVTAELAVGLPVVVLLLVAVLTLTAASTAQMRALDAARAGARAYAIGQDDAEVRRVVDRVGGAEAALGVSRDGDWVRVTVTRPVVGGWFAAAPVRASGEATAWVEP
ncbi:TadE family type IV pilus minor pilin [Isoptericola sp. BMS4]|uniref:TadE family type IV pilus minor pilin n=1 Tax=Isoptericola sp. BMS4 TaxID=2527875 RepID=UPI0014245CB6|nr:TadE family type IV pilus minor pilin [Isoptericola sp. BMS4]